MQECHKCRYAAENIRAKNPSLSEDAKVSAIRRSIQEERQLLITLGYDDMCQGKECQVAEMRDPIVKKAI